MDPQNTEPIVGESKEMETPEDVAVLYSWANLHGAKYRDFSASRREYRAQMRRRAAEKQREEELKAKAEAEAAAAAAEVDAQQAEAAAKQAEDVSSVDEKEHAMYELHEAQRRAKAERIEAERRAEAAALAEQDLLRAEREMADAHASAQRQAARYAESEHRRKHLAGPQPRAAVFGETSDPYTPDKQPNVVVEHHYHHPNASGASAIASARSGSHSAAKPNIPGDPDRYYTRETRVVSAASGDSSIRRRPATATSYNEHLAAQERKAEFERSDATRALEEERIAHEERQARREREAAEAGRRDTYEREEQDRRRLEEERRLRAREEEEANYRAAARREEEARREENARREAEARREETRSEEARREEARRDDVLRPRRPEGFRPDEASRIREAYPRREEPARREDPLPTRQFIPAVQPPRDRDREGVGERDREQDRYRQTPAARRETPQPPAPRPEYRRYAGGGTESRYMGAATSRSSIRLPDDLLERMGSVRPAGSEPLPPGQDPGPLGPAWLYSGQDDRQEKAGSQDRSGLHRSRQDYSRASDRTGAAASPIDDTLQQSRERVAARWYALKSFAEPGQEVHPEPEPQPVRQKEMRTPLLAVFSLAGGVGRTSLVATLGRALSSMGEKVLLTDTTTHSLLPFYFGASELRSGAVRTFSPPAGSSDAPISLVGYDIDQRAGDQAAQEWFMDELTRNSRGLQRVLLDLSGSSSWVARRLARLNPTVLVPVAPDMNSVISLQSVEKFFAGVTNAEGRQIQPHFLLNQFDASLPLHLDVREVLRQQLGDRLLPFVIRRSPAVAEALAEGMTVVDYAPDAPVSSDYMNVASWLRSIAAPTTAGFRNLRWSER